MTPHFFTVPAELRDMIYDSYLEDSLAFTNGTHHIEPARQYEALIEASAQLIGLSDLVICPTVVEAIPRRDVCALSHVSRQVRIEFLVYLYKHRAVQISSLDVKDGLWWIDTLYLARITTIHIKCYPEYRRGGSDVPVLDTNTVPSLRRLKFIAPCMIGVAKRLAWCHAKCWMGLMSRMERPAARPCKIDMQELTIAIWSWMPFVTSRPIAGLELSLDAYHCRGVGRNDDRCTGFLQEDHAAVAKATLRVLKDAIADLTYVGFAPPDF